jgi:hypothetical protein
MSASIGPTAPASVMAARPAPPPPPREGTISLKGVAGGLASGGTKWLVGQPFDLVSAVRSMRGGGPARVRRRDRQRCKAHS